MRKKGNKVHTTRLQKQTADNVIQQQLAGKEPNVKKAILEAGGSEATAHNPYKITKSKGYLAYMDKHGLTEDSIAGMIAADINALGAGDRFNYLQMVAKMRGMFESANLNVNVQQSDEGLEMLRGIITGEVVDDQGTTDTEPEQAL